MKTTFLPFLLLRHFLQWLFVRDGKVRCGGQTWKLPCEALKIIATATPQIFLTGTVSIKNSTNNTANNNTDCRRILCRVGKRCIEGEFFYIGKNNEHGFSITFGTKPGLKFLEIYSVAATGEQTRICSVLLNCKIENGDLSSKQVFEENVRNRKVVLNILYGTPSPPPAPPAPAKTNPQPLSSIIVPLCKNIRLLYYLLSLFEHEKSASKYELIFVADGRRISCDALRVANGLAKIFSTPFRLITTEPECGWTLACTTGAEFATGRYKQFLPLNMSPDAADCFQQLARQIKECTTAKIEPPAVQKLSTNQHKNHQQNRRRIITVANGHPNFLKGGAEVAAHALHNAWLNAGHDATFIARRPVGENVTGGLTQYNEHEFLFEASVGDPFLLTSSAPSSLVRSIKDLVLKLQPEFIHFHHYSCSGLELFPLFRNLCPNAKIALSLHEYLLICNNHGQFIRTAAGAASTGTVTNTIRTVSLCENASPAECQKCFPTRSAGEFLLRKLYFQNMLRNVDFFISPSDFLKERFVRWGLPAEKIHVIENGLSPVFLNTCRTERLNYPPATPVVFSYFGQINEFKGADLLLEAFTMLPAEIRKNVRLNIHASGLENQRHEYKSKIEKLLHEIQDVAEFFGQYSTADVPRLMAKTHYVVMASIWWENSPVVIQEAFSMGRPVICADIGGMKEKVINEKNGLHFSAGNVSSLRDVLVRAASDSHLIKYLSQNCKLALSSEATGAQILSLL